MSYKSVFRSLQEVFPQVDLRILKAVAIEHSRDVDAAVEFILSEVMPSISAPPEPSYTLTNTRDEKKAVAEAELKSRHLSLAHGVEEANVSPFSWSSWPRHSEQNFPDSSYAKTDLHAKPPGVKEAADSGSEVEHVVDQEDKGSLLGNQEVIEEASSSIPFEPTALMCENALTTDTTNDTFPISCIVEPVLTLQGEDSVQSCFNVESEVISLRRRLLESYQDLSAASTSIEHEDSIMNQKAFIDFEDLYGSDLPSALCLSFQNSAASVLENNLDSMQPGAAGTEDIGFSRVHVEESRLSVENGADQLVFDSENAIDDKLNATTKATQSGQVVSIDILEDFITDTKSNKNTLLSSMESIIDLMKEVELHEKEANQAKEAASAAGLDILEKAEDLKEMLKHAKEANNMHAGEVYGEKSILATEARELHSRLLSLSDEKDKSLSIIDEMCCTLEARLAAAEAERMEAEQEKLEKEETSRKVLAEQELIMDKVVNESKRLQQEAEENSKLREFLMDRGYMVDILQGEIAVVCEDVRALKERVDGRVPLSRSLSSSQTIPSLASSNTSRSSTSSHKVLAPVEPSDERPGTTIQELEGNTKGSEKLIASEIDRKVLLDDGWEFFDGQFESNMNTF